MNKESLVNYKHILSLTALISLHTIHADSEEIPLHEACKDGNLELVHELIAQGAHILEADFEKGRTALHIAAKKGDIAIVDALLQAGADIDRTDDKGRTAFHYAAKKGHLDLVAFFIETCAKNNRWFIHSRDFNGRSAADLARKKEHEECAHLIEAFIKTGRLPLPPAPLMSATINGDKDAVKELIEEGADIHQRNSDEFTCLHAAVYSGSESIVKILVEAGADVNAASAKAITPLMIACYIGDEDIVDYLLKKGADPNFAGEASALDLACLQGFVSLIKKLLKKGASIEQHGSTKWSPLLPAVVAGSAVAERLHSFFNSEFQSIAQKDAQSKANNDISTKDTCTIIRLLIKAGADVNMVASAEASEGESPLHIASFTNNTSVMTLLIKNKANVDISSPVDGFTPLILASRSGHKEAVELLLKHGANPTKPLLDGQTTPLMIAQEEGHTEIVALLEAAIAKRQ
jgi:ankyrin repeat protein